MDIIHDTKHTQMKPKHAKTIWNYLKLLQHSCTSVLVYHIYFYLSIGVVDIMTVWCMILRGGRLENWSCWVQLIIYTCNNGHYSIIIYTTRTNRKGWVKNNLHAYYFILFYLYWNTGSPKKWWQNYLKWVLDRVKYFLNCRSSISDENLTKTL